jgi:hypothetical protein
VHLIADLKDGLIRLESRFVNAPNNMNVKPFLTGDCTETLIARSMNPFHGILNGCLQNLEVLV